MKNWKDEVPESDLEKCLKQLVLLQEEIRLLNVYLEDCKRKLQSNRLSIFEENRHEAYEIIDVLTCKIKSSSILLQLNMKEFIESKY